MKILNYLFIPLLALGLFACKKSTDVNMSNDKADTFVGITLALPGSPLRAAGLPDDYNSLGKWAGRDKIKTIAVFLVNETKNTVDYTSFDATKFSVDQDMNLKPNLAVKATSGENVKAYVVINDEQDKITTMLKAVGAPQFAAKFQEAVLAKASEMSQYVAGENKDIILMTNDVLPTPTTVAPAISKDEAKAGPTNHLVVKVSRVVSRALVTMAPDLMTKTIPVTDAQGKAVSQLTLKSLTYSIGASNRQVFITRKADWKETPAPLYSFVPTDDALWKGGLAYMDYTKVTTYTDLQTITDNNIENVKKALAKNEEGRFVLPVTHADANYKKGNTTFFEVRAEFVPDALYTLAADGTLSKSTPDTPVTVFLGLQDGLFYASREAAEKSGQGAVQYKNGVMKYVLWLNPDQDYNGDKKIKKSPTVRNQIYHAHITAFRTIGVPNNPINPGTPPEPDPNNPGVTPPTNPDGTPFVPMDPDTPTIPDPQNPGKVIPDPHNPVNPIKPNDPLQNQDTYLSVEIRVLQWGMHSYTVSLGSDIY